MKNSHFIPLLSTIIFVLFLVLATQAVQLRLTSLIAFSLLYFGANILYHHEKQQLQLEKVFELGLNALLVIVAGSFLLS